MMWIFLPKGTCICKLESWINFMCIHSLMNTPLDGPPPFGQATTKTNPYLVVWWLFTYWKLCFLFITSDSWEIQSCSCCSIDTPSLCLPDTFVYASGYTRLELSLSHYYKECLTTFDTHTHASIFMVFSSLARFSINSFFLDYNSFFVLLNQGSYFIILIHRIGIRF
ncbi:hypothetical protein CsSME_00014229 [Camellia sinensis var. sinensis]